MEELEPGFQCLKRELILMLVKESSPYAEFQADASLQHVEDQSPEPFENKIRAAQEMYSITPAKTNLILSSDLPELPVRVALMPRQYYQLWQLLFPLVTMIQWSFNFFLPVVNFKEFIS